MAVKCSRAAVAARFDVRRHDLLALGQAPLGEALDALGRVAELVEAVVERPVLAAVDGLLADEARRPARLQLGVGDLVAEVRGPSGRRSPRRRGTRPRAWRRTWLMTRSPSPAKCTGQLRQRLVEGDAPGGDRRGARSSGVVAGCGRWLVDRGGRAWRRLRRRGGPSRATVDDLSESLNRSFC